MRWGWDPLKARERSQDPLQGSQEQQGRGDPQNKGGAQQAGLRLNGELALSGGGGCGGEEGTGTEPAPAGAAERAALQRVPGAVVCGGAGRGLGGSRAASPRGRLLLGGKEQAALRVVGHCSSSEDSWEMPSSSSFSFLGLPLGFLPGAVVAFRVLAAAPLFLLPFGRPRGLLGVGTSLGSF